MVNLGPPPSPRLVGGVLGTGWLPDNISVGFSARFRVTKEDGRPLSPGNLSGRVVHSFLARLASGPDPVPGFGRVVLLQVDLEGTVQLLHSLLSVSVGLYSMARRLFACCGELPLEGFPPVVDLPMDTFLVRRSV